MIETLTGSYKGIPYIIELNYYKNDGHHKVKVPHENARKTHYSQPAKNEQEAQKYAHYLIDKHFKVPSPFDNESLTFEEFKVTTKKSNITTKTEDLSYQKWMVKLFKNDNLITFSEDDEYSVAFEKILLVFDGSR